MSIISQVIEDNSHHDGDGMCRLNDNISPYEFANKIESAIMKKIMELDRYDVTLGSEKMLTTIDCETDPMGDFYKTEQILSLFNKE